MDKKKSLEILKSIRENLKNLPEEEKEKRRKAFWDNLLYENLTSKSGKEDRQFNYNSSSRNVGQIETVIDVA